MNETNMRTLVNEIMDETAAWSGLVLFEVTIKWANQGRLGETRDIVLAGNAIEALQRAWDVEDPADIRDVKVRWLCCQESVKKAPSED